MMFSGEPNDIDELLRRLKTKPDITFVDRLDDPMKDPHNFMSRIGIDELIAEPIVWSLKKSECIRDGLPCDDPHIPCSKMWEFKHRYSPINGNGPYDLYIKLASKTRLHPGNRAEETLIVYAISFHEDIIPGATNHAD